jgi:gluconate 2-dehydrogenase subunit 3-like protein
VTVTGVVHTETFDGQSIAMPDDRSIIPAATPNAAPRRTFVARLAGLIASWPVIGRATVSRAFAGQPDRTGLSQPNAALLGALGDAVLPAELGAPGVARAVAEFERWMTGYRPGAEANHGYGTGKIERLPADPRPAWRAQLEALDVEARRSGGQSFATLSRERRQSLIRTALAGERGESFPNPLLARHIALAMLAHFYDSAVATDLCYDAEIGRQQCRPLAAQREQPVALGRRAR